MSRAWLALSPPHSTTTSTSPRCTYRPDSRAHSRRAVPKRLRRRASHRPGCPRPVGAGARRSAPQPCDHAARPAIERRRQFAEPRSPAIRNLWETIGQGHDRPPALTRKRTTDHSAVQLATEPGSGCWGERATGGPAGRRRPWQGPWRCSQPACRRRGPCGFRRR